MRIREEKGRRKKRGGNLKAGSMRQERFERTHEVRGKEGRKEIEKGELRRRKNEQQNVLA